METQLRLLPWEARGPLLAKRNPIPSKNHSSHTHSLVLTKHPEIKVAFVIHTTLLLDRIVIKCFHRSSAAMPRWQSLWSLCCSVTTCRAVLKHRLAARCFLRVDKRGKIDRPTAHPTNQQVTKSYPWVQPASQTAIKTGSATVTWHCGSAVAKMEGIRKTERSSYCQWRYFLLGVKSSLKLEVCRPDFKKLSMIINNNDSFFFSFSERLIKKKVHVLARSTIDRTTTQRGTKFSQESFLCRAVNRGLNIMCTRDL